MSGLFVILARRQKREQAANVPGHAATRDEGRCGRLVVYEIEYSVRSTEYAIMPARKNKAPVKQSSTARSALPPSSLFAPLALREIVLFLAVLLTGTAIRAQALSHSAVEHFDEGVYASNLYLGPPD
jgi:hypothetical protein